VHCGDSSDDSFWTTINCYIVLYFSIWYLRACVRGGGIGKLGEDNYLFPAKSMVHFVFIFVSRQMASRVKRHAVQSFHI